MELPPEIRNQIYNYLFPPQRVEIRRSKDITKTQHHYHLYHKQLAPRDPLTQIQTCLPFKPRLQTQLCLPFTSKKLHQETLCLLYACTQFVFTSPKCISLFLKKTPKQAQAAIQHIEIHHTMYNEPSLTTFRELKLRSDKSWYMLCEKISVSFTALRVLHVDMTIFDAPIELEVGESWSLPILAFGRAKARAGRGMGKVGALRFAKVNLTSYHFDYEKVHKVERQLEKELMGPIAFQVREDEEFARALVEELKARKVLRLVFS
ncbi:uncharacterized protein APUU_60506A [Aspergillus puulaauensis]|uniref:DUF7730 domain-containing protein n=1 Tax=Aspergillus puulaauensis TaxID=1220207 RepID=A0A7R8AS23_9EURO|nr:uncharacterized protein APUU_60506A [Aspergillus puulaauensis]BCS27458.1 hypothetical protein APUU_60506A [Aspergillus puulaauensis]